MSAKETLDTILEDVNETLIEDWIKKLERAGKDPEVYAQALAQKAKRLNGCDGFFVSMHKQDKEDEWLVTQLRKAEAKVSKATKSDWPYPEGRWDCARCIGRGWYAEQRLSLSEEDQARLDRHENDGYIPVTYRDTTRIVFICPECNPEGKVMPDHEGKILPRHPVGGVGVADDYCPF